MGSFCICSRRALELFVQEACGVSLRTSRPTPIIPFSRGRNLGTRSRLRQLQPAALTRQDDSFIPFDADGKSAGSLATPLQGEEPGHLRQAEQLLDKDTLDNEWHAEVEIVAPWPQETNQPRAGERQEVAVSTRDGAAATQTSSVEDASLQNPHEPPPQSEPVQLQSVPSSPPNLHQISTADSGLARSRTENRMLRKLRRIQAGTFRATAETRVRNELKDSTVRSVLGIMKATRNMPPAEEQEGSTRSPPVLQAATPHSEAQDVDRTDAILRPKSAVRKATNQSTAAPTTKKAAPVAKESTSKNKAYASTTQQKSNTKRRASRSKLDASPTKQPASAIETNPKTKSERELWQTQKNALKVKFGEQGWQPRKRLSPDTLDGIRALHVSDPNAYTTPVLAAHFQVTPEAIRRILKSKWRPNTEEIDDRKDRWERRGERKWKAMAEQGRRPPAKWRAKGIKTPHAEQKRAARRQDGRYVRWEDDTLEDAGSSLAQRIR